MPRKKKVSSGQLTVASQQQPSPVNTALPTIWVDFMQVIARGSSGVATVRFFTLLPGVNMEVARLQMTMAHLENMGDVIRSTLERARLTPGTEKLGVQEGLPDAGPVN